MATTIPRTLEVIRDPTGITLLYVDGEEFPFALSAADPISVELGKDGAPGVRVTLLAHSVGVLDNLFADEDLNAGTHDPQEPS